MQDGALCMYLCEKVGKPSELALFIISVDTVSDYIPIEITRRGIITAMKTSRASVSFIIVRFLSWCYITSAVNSVS
jgi:hypothetical protein